MRGCVVENDTDAYLSHYGDTDREWLALEDWAKQLVEEIEDHYMIAIPNAEMRMKYLKMACELWNEGDISVVSEFKKIRFHAKHYEAILGNLDDLYEHHWDNELDFRYYNQD